MKKAKKHGPQGFKGTGMHFSDDDVNISFLMFICVPMLFGFYLLFCFTHACKYTHTHNHAYTHTHAHTHTHIYIYIHLHIYIYIYIYIYYLFITYLLLIY